MKIYDISQEVFSCKVFPGDPAPKKETLLKIAQGDKCNLTAFSMCAHNGTHVDAPYHFCLEGSTISEVPLEKFIGMAYVAEHEGELSADDAIAILEKDRHKIREQNTGEGRCGSVYFLNAAPIHLGGADGAPCRAVLIEAGV